MIIHDISMQISSNMPVYKNMEIKKPKLTIIANHKDNSIYETDLQINLHTGTHVDAPLHAIENGNYVESYSLEKFYGNALIIDLTAVKDHITRDDLINQNIQENDIILLKTINSYDTHFNFNFIYLSVSGAEYLAGKKIKTVGIDGLGIERSQKNHPTHKILLSNNIPIIEGLRLSKIEKGRYTFIGFPISISSVEASFLRAVLVE